MAENEELVNEEWQPETVAFINDLRNQDLYLTYAVKNIIDSLVVIAKGAPLEYVVVADPSGELDANGRLEIAAGNTITDDRLEDKLVTLFCTSSGVSYNSGAYTKTQSSNTLTMTNGVSFGIGEVISLTVR